MALELGEYAHVKVESETKIQLPPEYISPAGFNTDMFVEAAIFENRLLLLWKDGVTSHDAATGEQKGQWKHNGIGLDFGDAMHLGLLLMTQADRRDAPDGSAQQVTLLHPETLAPVFSKPATAFTHERLPGDAPLSFERAYLANDGIIWAIAHEFKSGVDRSVVYEITRNGDCHQVFILAEPLPVQKKIPQVDHVGERIRKESLVQLTCSADRRWVHLVGKFDIWEIDINDKHGTLDNPVPLRPVKKLTTFVRDMKMERVFWDVNQRWLLVTPDNGKEFVFFQYVPDPKADEYSLKISRIGVYCGDFPPKKQTKGLFTWEKGQARPLLFKEVKLVGTQMFSTHDGRYLMMGDFGEAIPLLIFDTYTWKTVDITQTDHPELVPVGMAPDDALWAVENDRLLRVRMEAGPPPKESSAAKWLIWIIVLGGAVAAALYYFLVVRG